MSGISTLLSDISGDALGADRTLMLPSISASPQDLYDAATQVAREHGLAIGKANARAQEVATRIVTGMGERSSGQRAEALGILKDEDAYKIVKAYAQDYIFDAL